MCEPGTSSISITCKLVRNANSQLPSQTCWIRNSGWGANQAEFQQASYIDACWSMRTTENHYWSRPFQTGERFMYWYLDIENWREWSQTLEEGERDWLKETDSWLGKIRKFIRKIKRFLALVFNEVKIKLLSRKGSNLERNAKAKKRK